CCRYPCSGSIPLTLMLSTPSKFFFSSRRRHTRFSRDWSSDVCSSDLRGLLPGPGTEPGEARAYEPGDDVRTMDWSVTARTTVPHIRQTIADRELETWIVVDMAPSLDVQGRYGTKRRLVEAAVATVGFLSAVGGSRVGLVLTGV